jgi:hypothetical protein
LLVAVVAVLAAPQSVAAVAVLVEYFKEPYT